VSLRTRLATTFVAFFAIALIALEIGTYLVVRQYLIAGVDSQLQLGADLLQQNFTERNKRLFAYEGDWRLLFVSLGGFNTTDLLVQIYDSDGVLKARSPNLQQEIPADPGAVAAILNGGEPAIRTQIVADVRMRQLLTPLRFGDQIVGTVLLARPLAETERALQVLIYALTGAGLIVLLAAARGGAWLTRAALRPIDQITQTAQSIVSAEDLSRRVPVPESNDELQRLTITINDMLARMEALFNAQRRFVADVSHELRTPLAAMQGNLDVLSRGAAHDPELLAESLADMRSEVNRLIRMVNDLLLLAQSDAGVQLRREPVELDTLLLEVHREMRSLANGVQLRLGAEDQATVLGDRDRIKQAVLNLVVNAIQHTPPGGAVTLGLATDGGEAVVSVADTGTGIDPAALPHIFERFYRGDRARTRDRGGAGLGLAIVKWIVEAHGGSVAVESAPGRGSVFSLRLPLQPAGAPLPAPGLSALPERAYAIMPGRAQPRDSR
jgi:heavy metal sensor kinase